MDNKQMKVKYPGLEGLPNDFHAFMAHKAGIVRAAVGLQATKKLALEQKEDLRFNASVKSVDRKAGTVTLECGKVFRGKHIVVACGPFSGDFYDKGDFEMRKSPQETYVINNNQGLPGAMIISGVPEFGGYDIYALLDGPNLD